MSDLLYPLFVCNKAYFVGNKALLALKRILCNLKYKTGENGEGKYMVDKDTTC